jgi:predicted DNA binding CopG/RHH family protein
MVMKMNRRDLAFENGILEDFKKGKLKSVGGSKTEMRKYKQAARATFIKNRRVNIRLSSPDLMDIQARALEEGVPYPVCTTSASKLKTKSK